MSTPILQAGDPKIPEPKKMVRAKQWSEEAEEAWRLQQAGYKDIIDYQVQRNKNPDRWDDDNMRIKKLEVLLRCSRGDNERSVCFMYFDRKPELQSKELHTVKIYYR